MTDQTQPMPQAPTSIPDPVQQLVDQAQDVQQTFAVNDMPSAQPSHIPTSSGDTPIADSDQNLSTQPVPQPAMQDQVASNQVAMDESTQTVEVPASSADTTATVPNAASDNAAKSPLDILEEILGKSEAAPVEPTIPEKTPEEIEAERLAHEAEQQALLEQQRLHLQAEVSSEEQQKRDAIRQEQMLSNQAVNDHDIYQIQREKISNN